MKNTIVACDLNMLTLKLGYEVLEHIVKLFYGVVFI